MSRKPLSKKIRFEVFKRDHFTCQYCGQMAPDVILEADHVVPVAEGGTDDLVNLITSCRDCNRGKGKRKLTDSDELKKQQVALDDIATRREQAEMMAEWRQALADTQNELAKKASDYIGTVSGFTLSDIGMQDIKKLIKKFSFDEVMEAIEIAYDRYYDGSERSWNKAFNKIGGICYNRKNNIKSGQRTITIKLDIETIEAIEKEMTEHDSWENFDNVSEYISDMLSVTYWLRSKEDGDI